MNPENFQSQQTPRDQEMWELAQRRAGFKTHFITYLVVISFLWLIWYFTTDGYNRNGFPWPVWPTAGWGLGLLFHYLGAYVFPRNNAVQKEYDKLMQSKKNQ